MSVVHDMELDLILKNIKDANEEENFIKKYVRPYVKVRFHVFLQNYMIENDISLASVMNNSRINKNYGYNIVNGIRENPGRDKVIALCIGAGMSFDDVQQALKTANHPMLDPRDERDVRIAVAINNGINDVLKVNLKLEENDLEPLRC